MAGPPDLVVHNVGTSFRHGPEFRIHRPRGSGDWSSSTYFSRCFRSRVGCAPRDYVK